MASVAEKEALGLPSSASADAILAKIASLTSQAEEAKTGPDPRIAEMEKSLKEEKSKNEGLLKSNDELLELVEKLQGASGKSGNGNGVVTTSEVDASTGDVPEGHVRTEVGIEPLVKKRVKVLAASWTTLKPDVLRKGNYVQIEHRHTRGDVVDVPASVAERFTQPDIDAFFDTVDPPENTSESGEISFAQMSEADLINWHRAVSPSTKQMIDAAAGDPDTARRLLEAEDAATGGDSREEVVHALAEVLARDS